MKKLLIKIAWNLILENLIELAEKQFRAANHSDVIQRWSVVLDFLRYQQKKGPL